MDELSGKFKEKAEIERGKAKLDSLIQQQDKEKALYANEECVSELCEVHSIELLVILLAPRTKAGLTHRFEMTGNISNEVQKIPNKFPYIGVATGDDSLLFYLVVERTALYL